MKRKIDFKIIVICILFVILIIISCLCANSINSGKTSNSMNISNKTSQKNDSDTTSSESSSKTNKIKSNCEIESSLTEDLSLHATYYLEECYASENQLVNAGENIVKYTNGEYFTAPYDCVVTKINIPSSGEKITNEHYIEVESTNNLKVELSVDETDISSINIGQDAQIEVEAFDDKTLSGNVTDISNVASSGKFTVTVEFNNDGEVKIGMSAKVTI